MAFEFIENNGDTECFAPTTTLATTLWLDRCAGVPRHDRTSNQTARRSSTARIQPGHVEQKTGVVKNAKIHYH